MFITLEGIEGSGKTTQIGYLVEFFSKRGKPYISTREPGGTLIGRKIRSILLDPASADMDAKAELMLYMADRAQHLSALVKPSLSAGKTVICDRYFDATLAYQGFARGLDIDFIKRLHKLLFAGLMPDLTLLLDLPPAVGLRRAWKQLNSGKRVGGESRFEEETLAFHERVRAGYLGLARLEPDRIRVIDATRNENRVREEIGEILSSLLSS
jgi:dTMP kinase